MKSLSNAVGSPESPILRPAGIDTDGLAVCGFTLIRNLLEGRIAGGEKVALKVAEALHNLPVDGNAYTVELTRAAIETLASEYPQAAMLRQFIHQGNDLDE